MAKKIAYVKVFALHAKCVCSLTHFVCVTDTLSVSHAGLFSKLDTLHCSMYHALLFDISRFFVFFLRTFFVITTQKSYNTYNRNISNNSSTYTNYNTVTYKLAIINHHSFYNHLIIQINSDTDLNLISLQYNV